MNDRTFVFLLRPGAKSIASTGEKTREGKMGPQGSSTSAGRKIDVSRQFEWIFRPNIIENWRKYSAKLIKLQKKVQYTDVF